MSRVLKDLLVACVLTLVGLTIGLLLAGVDAHAGPVDRAAERCSGSASPGAPAPVHCAAPTRAGVSLQDGHGQGSAPAA